MKTRACVTSELSLLGLVSVLRSIDAKRRASPHSVIPGNPALRGIDPESIGLLPIVRDGTGGPVDWDCPSNY